MPSDALSARIAQLTDEQRGLLAARLSASAPSTGTRPIPRSGVRDGVALGCAQEGFWLLHQDETASAAYNCRTAHRLRGALDVGALQRSLDLVVERHEALRASFHWKNGSVTQTITRHRPVEIAQVDFPRVAAADLEPQLAEAVAREARRTFDLTSGDLLRATLFRLAADDHLLLIVMPHIAADRWSRGVLHGELALAYRSVRRGEEPVLPDLPIQYADFAAWQQPRIRGSALDHARAYWKAALKGAPAALELPTDRARPPEQTFAGATHRFLLEEPLVDRLRAFSRAQNATLFMTLFAGFAAVLSRWTGLDDLVIGTSSAGRISTETERLIGCFINTLPLRVDVSDAPPFIDLVGRVRRIALEAYAHAELPFKHIVSEAGAERSVAHGPLVQVMLTLQNSPQRALSLDGLAVEQVTIDAGVSKLDLTLEATATNAGLSCALEFRTDLFRVETIERLAGHWRTLLAAAVENPLTPVTELPLMTAAEQDRLVAWNRTETPFDARACVHEFFETQARRTPDAVAACCDGQSLTYRELDQRSTRLAHFLQARGVGPDILVGLLMERSIDMLVALLGVLKAGGAYVPLDPAYPSDRIAFMLTDSGAHLLVTQSNLTAGVSHDRMVCLDRDWPAIERESLGPVASGVASTHLAYVIYTSGSTGTPKGVMVEHRNVANFFAAMDGLLGREPGVWLAVTSISFDLAVLELFWTLARGYRVVLRPDTPARLKAGDRDTTRDVSVSSLARMHGATHLQCTPSMLRVVLLEPDGREALAGLQNLLVGGEPLPASLVADLGAVATRRIANMYGPTETTVWSTSWTVDATAEVMSIGRPVANTLIHILDAQGQPVPVGVQGELYIAGAGVTRGYLGRAALTAERFVPELSVASPAARMYRTGDLARYQPDGTIEFLGRADHQVKFRGFRIELGEIEAALARHETVSQAVVAVREDRPGDPYLAAYVVPAPGQSTSASALQQHLRRALPDYMVPSHFAKLDALPLTPNRKIDRRALPALALVTSAPARQPLATSPTARALLKMWTEVLDVPTSGLDDDFFDLGGHSLLAVQLMSRVEETLGRRLPLAILFEARTVRALAEILDDRKASWKWISLVPVQTLGSKPPFFCVHGVGGEVLAYSALAARLAPDQPVIAFRAPGYAGSAEPLNSIEEQAALYVREMIAFQPDGPYYIGGYSHGGRVALEMALQLEAMGRTVAFLGIIDTTPCRSGVGGFSRLGGWLRNLPMWWWYDGRESSMKANLSRLRRLWHRVGSPSAAPVLDDMMNLDQLPAGIQELYRKDFEAYIRYRPARRCGEVTVFRSLGRPLMSNHERDLGWRRVSRGSVEVRRIPGNHLSILSEPHVGALAAELRDALERAQARAAAAETGCASPGRGESTREARREPTAHATLSVT